MQLDYLPKRWQSFFTCCCESGEFFPGEGIFSDATDNDVEADFCDEGDEGGSTIAVMDVEAVWLRMTNRL